MKTTSLAFMSVAILGVGLFGITSASFSDVSEVSSLSSGESAGILGHVTVTHANADGEIISYSQGDNVVVDQGEQGIAHIMFGSKNATDGLASDEAFNRIGLFDASLGAPSTSTTFANVDAADYASGTLQATEITRNDEGTTGNCADQVLGNTNAALTYLQCTFTSDQTTTVYGAFISNNGTADTLFAAQNFTSSTGITLNDQDQLTVKWDISLT